MEADEGSGRTYVTALLVATALSFLIDTVIVLTGGEFNRLISLLVWLILLLAGVLVATLVVSRRRG